MEKNLEANVKNSEKTFPLSEIDRVNRDTQPSISEQQS